MMMLTTTCGMRGVVVVAMVGVWSMLAGEMSLFAESFPVPGDRPRAVSSMKMASDASSTSVIRAVTPNIVTVSTPFLRSGVVKIGGRGTIVRMKNGSIAVFSPTTLTPEVRSTLQKMGNDVRYIAAPDIEHHIFLSQWAQEFPDANILGPEGLPEKREKDEKTSGTRFTHVWTEANKRTFTVDEPFDTEFDYEFVHAHVNKEIVFLYKPEKTLIQADLIFNLPAKEQYSKVQESPTSGILSKLFSNIMNVEGSGQKFFLWNLASASDRKAFGESIRRIDTWDFDRIIPCHGDVIETGAKSAFRNVMEWHLK